MNYDIFLKVSYQKSLAPQMLDLLHVTWSVTLLYSEMISKCDSKSHTLHGICLYEAHTLQHAMYDSLISAHLAIWSLTSWPVICNMFNESR